MMPVLSVSDFIEQINGIVAGEFLIEGEVSQYGISQGKWIFFTLKDSQSVLSCFSTVFMLRAPLEDGMKVRVYGYPKIHEKSGKFSFTVQRVEMVGEGALKKAYELLKAKLSAEGLFAEDRKRSLPYAPSRIGVIASRDSAAFGDFKKIIQNRWAGLDVVLRHVSVQGEQAISDIVQAFADFEASEQPPQAIVLIRGGGSLEDLAAFNSEEVVRAIYTATVPVIAGIGHERDVSLAELAADVRASTPSNAAEIIVPDKNDFVANLEFEMNHIAQTLQHIVTSRRALVERALYVVSSKLESPLVSGKMLVQRFGSAGRFLADTAQKLRENVVFADRMLLQSNPRHVLRRGYSITRNAKGAIIRNAEQVVAGEQVVIELGEGSVLGEVLDKNKKTRQRTLL